MEENLIDLSIKNLQILWETGKKKPKNLIISRKNLPANILEEKPKVGKNQSFAEECKTAEKKLG